VPTISLVPTIWAVLGANWPFWLFCSLTSIPAVSVDG